MQQGRTHDAVDVAAKTLTLLRERRIGGRLLAEALVWSSEAARADDDVALSLEHLTEAVEIGRNLLSADDETPQALRDLSVSLNKVGDAHREAGELAAAATLYEEALTPLRAILNNYAQTPRRTFQDLMTTILGKLEDVAEARGDRVASAAYRRERKEIEGDLATV